VALGEIADGCCEIEVELRDAERLVRRGRNRDRGVGDLDDGMVVEGIDRTEGIDDEVLRCSRGREPERRGERRLAVTIHERPPVTEVAEHIAHCRIAERRRATAHGWVISAGFTASSKASEVKNPSSMQASFSVVPSLWAFLATWAALS